ncbi:MAG: 1,4-alpha-glucan branching protein GlgB [Planctomyces sp.]|nr:1,4-alpha-glucan branching protein GlgB [Planctomyces sp.]
MAGFPSAPPPADAPPSVTVLRTGWSGVRDAAALARGVNCTMYRTQGAHPAIHEGRPGTWFSVWAPNAREVCVVGDFNYWQHGSFYLNSSDAGVWWGFVPGVGVGDHYKYSIRSQEGTLLEKCDPFAFAAEVPPKTASIVYEHSGFRWTDADWMERRREYDWSSKPVSMYEVHLGSWRRPWDNRRYHTYGELAEMLIPYALDMGFTHLQLMPITEFPFDGSWGYQPTGYFAPTSRFGSPEDFQKFVDACHNAGLGVLIDWVPGHFPTDAHGLGRFDGTALYEHEDMRQGFHPDWNTYIFNYGRNEVRSFLLSSARFWCDVYHIDGLRVDAVASMLYLDYSRNYGEWVPNPFGGRENLEAIQFLKDLNTVMHGEFPGVLMIAEESTAWPGVSRPVYDGGLGFSGKWDMGWMNDTLRYLRRDPVYRKHYQNELSFRMVYAFTENFLLPLSHDEVVHGKGSLLRQMPNDDWQKFANLRLLFGYQFTMPGKTLLFMGNELAPWSEWNHDSQLDWQLLQYPRHQGVQNFVRDLNKLVKSQPALHERDFASDGFEWIGADDAGNSVYVFCRFSADRSEELVIVLNMTPVPRKHYRIGVPSPGFYAEIMNSDARLYGGEDVGNGGGVEAEPIPSHGRYQSVQLTLPPLGMVVLKAGALPTGLPSAESAAPAAAPPSPPAKRTPGGQTRQ